MEKIVNMDSNSKSIHPISSIELQLDNKTSSILNESELALCSLDLSSQNPIHEKALKDACLLLESMANLRMSGHLSSLQEILHIQVLKPYYTNSRNEKIKIETLRNNDAFMYTTKAAEDIISEQTLCQIHSILLTGNMDTDIYMKYRTDDRLFDTNKYYAFESAYHAPEASRIPELMSELAYFCNQSSMPAVAQAAIVHAQFISIHPFNRANGKTARSLYHLIFSKRNITKDVIVPISLAMSLSSHNYQSTITATMQNLTSDCIESQELNRWLKYFGSCCLYAAAETNHFKESAEELQRNWLNEIKPRIDSATTSLIHGLPGLPVFTAESASKYIGRSYKRTNSAIAQLLDKGVITQITSGKRNRVFECPDMIKLYSLITGLS